uniref:P53 and DNA damage-regulated protein 1 n=1 Tax=Strongyloides papillosus TaxID=174720 RepID=A0A0N5BSY3_STREA
MSSTESTFILDTTTSNVRKLLEVTPKNPFGREIIEKMSTLKYLGNEVLGAKYEIVELDKVRQKTREVLRKLKESEDQKKTSIVVNDKLMLKLPTKFVIKELEKINKNSDIEIEKTRELLKDKVDKLKKFEGDKDLETLGFRLNPVTVNTQINL